MDSLGSIIVFVLTALFSSLIGFREWRTQLILKKKHDLAEDVLTLFYRCQGLLRHIRSPMGFGGEGSGREPGPNESPEEKEARDRAYVPLARYQQHQEVFDEIFALRFRMMALFGKEAAQPIEGLKDSVGRIFTAASMLATIWGRSMSNADTTRHEETIYGCFDDEDRFDVRVRGFIEDMEAICRPILNPPPLSDRIRLWCRRIGKGPSVPHCLFPPI